ncbi:MAG: ATP/GTP-binding protein [Crenarchaeota archaeon]|jgi:hypothetical protein|nr:ATP/GTP-binding protein [Thermoproteota archaeon]
MSQLYKYSFNSLKDYCEAENFAGWDPYDGLNSKLFSATPLKHWDIARLAWIQGFKRSPINFRKLLLVPKQHNAKGIGLFLTGYCNIYKLQENNGDEQFGTQKEILNKINYLAELLISMQSKGFSGACWGYNFDWQARRSFFFPKDTPTVVATTFAATALFEAYEATKNESWLRIALSSADFVLNDLNRTKKKRGFLFSYSPFKGNDTVYNASLLGSKLLSYCYYYSKDENLKAVARQSILACTDAQQADGSWLYGELPVQSWIDSFHTGYNLDALISYQEITGDDSFAENIEKGFDFYIKNFFLEDGTPKYYHNKTYPIDIHCPGQLFVTLNSLNKFTLHSELPEKVLNWTIKNMQDKRGYFYYQIKKGVSSKISYMRWSNAFMFYAMSYYLLDKQE